jgi:hypothetical protein
VKRARLAFTEYRPPTSWRTADEVTLHRHRSVLSVSGSRLLGHGDRSLCQRPDSTARGIFNFAANDTNEDRVKAAWMSLHTSQIVSSFH